MKKNGLAVEFTDSGEPRLAKTDPQDKVTAAEKACESLKPALEPQQISAEQLANERRRADCLRRQGLDWVPDPNPSTAVIELTPEQTGELKTKHADALLACRSKTAKRDDSRPDVLGG
ncbi:hypothetical protein ACFV9E_36945 [Streptomyces sp. NPDC059835]|uniref:hypothetical protein n=1 Tax=Streptomyces sp. NPDC059835 TaxID=3346967 RepID=UPI00365B5D0F